ncbi:PAS domain-containing protein [Fontisphaera persica]|uniref:PAS domain-containing protein n=1 Tax=Fontisphaera persica TaxID=2974023 RepID=UPI0024C0B1A8|nr:PAS domain-containing protein [Fontisphaera persica]WCJ58826.1 PAS domain-containing protein [Fontisphaera persica]
MSLVTEQKRLAALQEWAILDTQREIAFDDLASLAAACTQTSIALITFLDDHRAWCKAAVGIELVEIPREQSFTELVVATNAPMVIEDARNDKRLEGRHHGWLGQTILFMAGVPLRASDGLAVGALIVADSHPRHLSPSQLNALERLARQVMSQVGLRDSLQKLDRALREQEETEARLAYERNLFETLLQNIPDCIYFKDLQSRFVKCSQALAERFGFADPSALVGKTDQDFFGPEHALQAYEDEQRIIRTGQPLIGLTEKETYTDGRVTWALTTKMPWRDENGRIIGTFGISKDITDFKVSEELLAKLGQRHQLILNAVNEGIIGVDHDGRCIFANLAAAKIFRRTSESMVGQPLESFLANASTVLGVDHQGQLTETEFVCADGRLIPVEFTVLPLLEADTLTGSVLTFRDITARRRVEAQLAFEHDLLRALLENIPDRIYFKDLQSRFLLCSKTVVSGLGIQSAEEAIGKSDFDFFTEEHARPAYEDEQQIIRTGQPIIGKIERETWVDGRETWALTTKVPLRNSRGEIIGTLGVTKDITDLKRTQAELERARDAALESTRLKSEFLANMSHEIRTPMNGIIGMTGLLLDTPLTQEQREFAETIRSSADALLTIINDILDFSKIEAGKLTFENVSFDLSEAVEGSVELLAERARAKGLEMGCWIHPDVPPCLRGDPGRLRQVLANLLGNAVKFTERGEVYAEVSVQERNPKEVTLKFLIRDTGIGIPADAQKRLFQAFTQADGSVTRKYGGTGLGLAISKKLVELMGGQIGMTSQVGKGSEFWFTARFGIGQGLPEPLDHAANLAGLRVLIVDDSDTNRRVLHHQCEAWQMEDQCATDGVEAITTLRAAANKGQPFDIALLDMQMPGMDGLTLARLVKSDPMLSGTRLVMLTSLGHRLTPETLSQAGISAYLVKPVKQSRLFDCLVRVLAGAGGARPQHTVALQKTEAPATLPRLRVLVAEDNIVNQRVTVRQLQKMGQVADAVANGVEAVKALRAVPYDVVLMDCQMPEMDGYEATRIIRQEEAAHPERRRAYIIALTANALQGDREKCLAAGMDDYISKPVQVPAMQAALQRAANAINNLAHKPEPPPPAHAPAPLPPPLSSPYEHLPLLDADTIQNLSALQSPEMPDPVAELFDLFLTDLPKYLGRLQQGLDHKNPADLAAAAHALKGAAANLGLRRLAACAADLEKAGKEGNLPVAAALHGLLLHEMEEARHALNGKEARA